MARRMKADSTAIGQVNVDQIKREIRSQVEKLFRMQRLTLTKDEFIQAFYKPDHVRILQEALRICGDLNDDKSMGFDFAISGRKLSLSACFKEGFGLPFPSYSLNGLIQDCPDELRDRFHFWAQHRVEQGDLAGDLIDAFQFLNKRLPNPRSLAVMLPCAPALARKAGVNETTLIKMTKGPFSLAPLPREVAQRMQMASSFVMNLMMLTEPPDSYPDCYIERSVYSEMNRRDNLFARLGGDSYCGSEV